jgi:hypothetical protein
MMVNNCTTVVVIQTTSLRGGIFRNCLDLVGLWVWVPQTRLTSGDLLIFVEEACRVPKVHHMSDLGIHGQMLTRHEDQNNPLNPVGLEYRILGLPCRLRVLVSDHAVIWYSLVSPSRIGLR